MYIYTCKYIYTCVCICIYVYEKMSDTRRISVPVWLKIDGYCSTAQALLDWFEVHLGRDKCRAATRSTRAATRSTSRAPLLTWS